MKTTDLPPPAEKSLPYAELLLQLREAAKLASVGTLLSWDQETMMPPRGAEFRAEELALISTLAHQRHTDPRIGELLAACEADPELLSDEVEAANLREMRRDYDRATKLPSALVAEMSVTSSRAVEVWRQARNDSDFPVFRPWLEKQVELNRRKAECYGAPVEGELYDALVEDFEPGMTSAELGKIFRPLRDALAPLIAEISASRRRPDPSPREVKLPIARQQELSRLVAERIGFDFSAGRLDVSTHPFSEALGPGDTRITSRYSEDQFPDSLGSTVHECGHAIYEQGLPKDRRYGQPLAESTSLGIHESQSRMWENQVGRSRPFWQWTLAEAKRVFGAALEPFTVEQVYGAVNRVSPTFIRVDSDEATYNLHVMLRFDIERALIRGELAVADVPGAWNERIKTDLGLVVPDDRRGCLQDIHWSLGSIGYFPTYTLGSLYAAQFWEGITRALPDLETQIARGEFGALRAWLRENIHVHGRRYRAHELCLRLTGRPLGHAPFMRYLEAKLRPIYGL